MKKTRILLVTSVLLMSLVFTLPAVIGMMPDRYVLRLPESLQRYGLPENKSHLLPTVEAPVAAANLLAEEAPLTLEPTIILMHTATPEPAKKTVDGGAKATTSLPTPTQAEILATIAPVVEPVDPTPTLTATPWPTPSQARMEGMQHKFQTWNNCGPATLAMALTFFGDQVSQEQTAAILKPNPEDRNVSPDEMVSYVNNHTEHRALFRANGTVDTLKRLVANNIPVIIETGIEPPGEFRWMGWYGHYLMIVAYDDAAGEFWVYDSWFGTSEEPLQNAHPDGRIVSYEDLDANWIQFNRNYIILYQPEQESLAQALIGADMDDDGMWDRAQAQAEAEIAAEPKNPFYWFNLGTDYTAQQQYEEAAIAFDQARALGLPWRMLWYQFGPYEAYLNIGRYDDVVLLADVTLENRPYFEESYYYKGAANAALGEKDAALENYRKAISFNPNFTPAQLALDKLEGR